MKRKLKSWFEWYKNLGDEEKGLLWGGVILGEAIVTLSIIWNCVWKSIFSNMKRNK